MFLAWIVFQLLGQIKHPVSVSAHLPDFGDWSSLGAIPRIECRHSLWDVVVSVFYFFAGEVFISENLKINVKAFQADCAVIMAWRL